MLIRPKLVVNELRNDIRYALLDLFAHCTKARNQPEDIRQDCIINNPRNNEIAMKTIFSLIEFKPLHFPATTLAGLKRNRELPRSLGEALRDIDKKIVDKVIRLIERNLTAPNLRKYLAKIKSARKDGFIMNMQNFFFPSWRESDERDLYTLAYMRILEEAYIFDYLEDALREYDKLQTQDNIVPYETISDTTRLAYSYVRQMPILAMLVVAFFVLYVGYIILTTSGTLNLSSIADAILLRTPYYFTAKSLAQSAVPGKATPAAGKKVLQ